MNRAHIISAGLLALGLVFPSGCASPQASRTDARSQSVATSDVIASRAKLVRVGMHKPQVIDWLGEPKSTIPASESNGMRETWTYEFERAPDYKTVAAVMELVAYVDPITGVLRWIEEPVLNQQRIQIKDTIELTFMGPLLVDVERSVDRIAMYRD